MGRIQKQDQIITGQMKSSSRGWMLAILPAKQFSWSFWIINLNLYWSDEEQQ